MPAPISGLSTDLGEHQAHTGKNQVFQQSHWQRDLTFGLNVEGMLPLEGVVAGKTVAPTHCQPRPLLWDWALSNLLTSVLTKINSQEESPWRENGGLECSLLWGKGRGIQELWWAPISSPHSLIFHAYRPQFPCVSN